jgi:anti-anti-sigma factor
MEISSKLAGPITIITITGSIDAMTYNQVISAVSQQVASGQVRILIDLGGVDFMSSAGLRAMLAGMQETREMGGDLRLSGAQPGIERVLKLSGFDSLLKSYPDLDQALADFSA